jgi:hypothetical protein
MHVYTLHSPGDYDLIPIQNTGKRPVDTQSRSTQTWHLTGQGLDPHGDRNRGLRSPQKITTTRTSWHTRTYLPWVVYSGPPPVEAIGADRPWFKFKKAFRRGALNPDRGPAHVCISRGLKFLASSAPGPGPPRPQAGGGAGPRTEDCAIRYCHCHCHCYSLPIAVALLLRGSAARAAPCGVRRAAETPAASRAQARPHFMYNESLELTAPQPQHTAVKT